MIVIKKLFNNLSHSNLKIFLLNFKDKLTVTESLLGCLSHVNQCIKAVLAPDSVYNFFFIDYFFVV